jgi:hypothetical protein
MREFLLCPIFTQAIVLPVVDLLAELNEVRQFRYFLQESDPFI